MEEYRIHHGIDHLKFQSASTHRNIKIMWNEKQQKFSYENISVKQKEIIEIF